jgi:hypothetical protein
MHMRRFDGCGDWHAPAAVADGDTDTGQPAPMSLLRRAALAFLAVVATLILAFALTAQANAASDSRGDNQCGLEAISASWSSLVAGNAVDPPCEEPEPDEDA